MATITVDFFRELLLTVQQKNNFISKCNAVIKKYPEDKNMLKYILESKTYRFYQNKIDLVWHLYPTQFKAMTNSIIRDIDAFSGDIEQISLDAVQICINNNISLEITLSTDARKKYLKDGMILVTRNRPYSIDLARNNIMLFDYMNQNPIIDSMKKQANHLSSTILKNN